MERSKSDSIKIDNLTNDQWENFKKKKIYFGHQSVGQNIIDGMLTIRNNAYVTGFNIEKLSNKNQLNRNALFHQFIGENYDPYSKINAFKNVINTKIGETVDIAFFKFCYVDIDANTNIQKLFEFYTTFMDTLINEYPNVTFIHTTIPLVSLKRNIKDWIKIIIGKNTIKNAEANIRRNEFNEMLRNKYDNKVPIFDIAKFESTLPNGQRVFFINNEIEYESMAPIYSNDGGHLNQLGRKVVANALLTLLSEVTGTN
ncbi:hypothetical protein JW960_08115 [candidate division KSB1 bacterium]|nr:hypothetical protein [candidate division KSB1 bacterium]